MALDTLIIVKFTDLLNDFLWPTGLFYRHWRCVKSIFLKKEKQTQKEQRGRRFVLEKILFLCVLTGNR